MAALLLIVIVSLALLATWYVNRHLSYWQRRRILHDEPKFPVGNMAGWKSKKHIDDIFQTVYRKYKGKAPFVGFFFFLHKTAVILDIDLVKNVLIKDFNHFEDRGIFHNERDDPLSATLVAIEGEKWRNLRHKMTPTFTSGKMKYMFPTVVKVGQQLAAVLAEKVNGVNGQVLEVTDLLARFTADAIGSCAFGLDCNSLVHPKADFVVMGRRAVSERRYKGLLDIFLFGAPQLAKKLGMKSTLHDVENFYMAIVRDTIKHREQSQMKRADFMDMLIEMKHNHDAGKTNGLTFDEVAAQAFIFFLAGFETSSSTMSMALYELAQHEHIQQRVRDEVISMLAKHNNEFTYECMKDMVYLEQVIDETLRMHPIVGHLVRRCNKHYKCGSDPQHYIEAGTRIVIPSIALHYDPEFFPEPEKFRPERFAPDEIQNRPACSYLPFGEGPRNCIGLRFGKMQSSIGLAYVIRHCKFSVAPETEIPLKIDNRNLLLSPQNGIRLRIEKVA